jgi:hypothetical protein
VKAGEKPEGCKPTTPTYRYKACADKATADLVAQALSGAWEGEPAAAAQPAATPTPPST